MSAHPDSAPDADPPELKRTEERYRAFIQNSAEGIWSFELDRPIPTAASAEDQLNMAYAHAFLGECNPAFAKMYGFQEPGQLTGTRLEDFLPRTDRHNVAYLLDFIRSNYHLIDSESHETDRSGEERIFLNNLTGVVENGFLVRVWGTQRDITRQRQAERALQASQDLLRQKEEQFRTLADSIPQLAWMAHANGWIFWYNRRWYEYTGTTEEQMAGWGWQSVHDPAVLPDVSARWQASIETGEPFEMVFPLKGADNRFRHFLTRVMPVRDGNGAISGWFGTNTDIEEQKRTETNLRRANADLEQFAYSASHDLQEPLRNVAIYSQLIHRKYRSKIDDEADRFLGYVLEGSQRMSHLLKALLSYIEVAQPATEPPDASPSRVLGQVLESLTEVIAKNSAQVTHADLPDRVCIPAGHLKLLFGHLVGNAIKYRDAGVPPRIHLTASTSDGMVRFSVRDNGIGIAPQFAKQIFGLFKRLHVRDKYPGTGIGLAICQKIVERYGGQIWVESEEGKGADFVFTLPQG